METVGAAVVAECANQYGDLQDEVGVVMGSWTTEHSLCIFTFCACVFNFVSREF